MFRVFRARPRAGRARAAVGGNARTWRPWLELLESRDVPSVTTGGDFNGDGYADLAIGVPGESVNGAANAGVVQVLYGTSSGLGPTGDQLWTQDSAGVTDSAESGDQFGSALAVGDFNGDGYDDLAVGIPYEDVTSFAGSKQNCGAVQIFHGSAAGLTASGSQFWQQDSPGVAHANEDDDHYGWALAAADFDGDGYADLAISYPNNRVGNGNPFGAGSIGILYGSAAGITTSGNVAFQQNSSGLGEKPEGNDHFGWALAAGDFNGDGYFDLAISAPDEDRADLADVGVVHIMFGGPGGLVASGAQLWHQNVSGVVDTNEAGDQFGYSLAAGDFNGDGVWDLAVGVPGENANGVSNAGAVHVFSGSTAGLTTAGNKLIAASTAGLGGTPGAGDRFGAVLAAGDFNGDRRDDLAIGVAGKDVAGKADAGAVFVLVGAAGGLTGAGGQVFTQNAPGVPNGAEAGDGFGAALVAGDFDGDGRTDLAIGVPGEDLNGRTDVGAVHVLYGTAGGLDSAASQFWHQDRPGLLDAAASGNHFGAALG